MICIYSSDSVACLFTLLKVFQREIFNSDEVQCINVFIFMAHPSGVISNKSYILHSHFTFGVRYDLKFIFCTNRCLVFQDCFFFNDPFSTELSLHLC